MLEPLFQLMVVKNFAAKKQGANWRLGGNFVGCSNRPVKMVKAKRRGKRGGVKMYPNPRDDPKGVETPTSHQRGLDVTFFLLNRQSREFLDSQVRGFC